MQEGVNVPKIRFVEIMDEEAKIEKTLGGYQTDACYEGEFYAVLRCSIDGTSCPLAVGPAYSTYNTTKTLE